MQSQHSALFVRGDDWPHMYYCSTSYHAVGCVRIESVMCLKTICRTCSVFLAILVSTSSSISDVGFSPLRRSYQPPERTRCYQVALPHSAKLACATWCHHRSDCVGFSFDQAAQRCNICDFDCRSSSGESSVSDFHLKLVDHDPEECACQAGRNCFIASSK